MHVYLQCRNPYRKKCHLIKDRFHFSKRGMLHPEETLILIKENRLDILKFQIHSINRIRLTIWEDTNHTHRIHLILLRINTLLKISINKIHILTKCHNNIHKIHFHILTTFLHLLVIKVWKRKIQWFGTNQPLKKRVNQLLKRNKV